MYFNEGTASTYDQTQKSLKALDIFIDHIIGNFPGTIDRVKQFKILLELVRYELIQTKIRVEQLNGNLDLGEILKECKQNSTYVIDSIPLYLTKTLMSHLLGEMDFDIKELYTNVSVRKSFENSEFGRKMVSLCNIPVFKAIFNNNELSNEMPLVENSLLLEGKASSSAPSGSKRELNKFEKYELQLIGNTNLMETYEKILGYLHALTIQVIFCKRLEKSMETGGKLVCVMNQTEIQAVILLMSKNLQSLELSMDNLKSCMDLIKLQWARGEIRGIGVFTAAVSQNAGIFDSIKEDLAQAKNSVDSAFQKIRGLDIYALMNELNQRETPLDESFQQIMNIARKFEWIPQEPLLPNNNNEGNSKGKGKALAAGDSIPQLAHLPDRASASSSSVSHKTQKSGASEKGVAILLFGSQENSQVKKLNELELEKEQLLENNQRLTEENNLFKKIIRESDRNKGVDQVKAERSERSIVKLNEEGGGEIIRRIADSLDSIKWPIRGRKEDRERYLSYVSDLVYSSLKGIEGSATISDFDRKRWISLAEKSLLSELSLMNWPNALSAGDKERLLIEMKEKFISAIKLMQWPGTISADDRGRMLSEVENRLFAALDSMKWPEEIVTAAEKERWLGQVEDLLFAMVKQNERDFSEEMKENPENILTKRLSGVKRGSSGIVSFLVDFASALSTQKIIEKAASIELKKVFLNLRSNGLTAEDTAFIESKAFDDISEWFKVEVVDSLFKISDSTASISRCNIEPMLKEVFEQMISLEASVDSSAVAGAVALKKNNDNLVRIIKTFLEVRIKFAEIDRASSIQISLKSKDPLYSNNLDELLMIVKSMYKLNQAIYAIGHKVKEYELINFVGDFKGFINIADETRPSYLLGGPVPGEVQRVELENGLFEILLDATVQMLAQTKGAFAAGLSKSHLNRTQFNNEAMGRLETAKNNYMYVSSYLVSQCLIM